MNKKIDVGVFLGFVLGELLASGVSRAEIMDFIRITLDTIETAIVDPKVGKAIDNLFSETKRHVK